MGTIHKDHVPFLAQPNGIATLNSDARLVTSQAEIVFLHSVDIPSVAAIDNYYTPVGSWFLNAAGETTLEINFGAGFVPQTLGVDYELRPRVNNFGNVYDAVFAFSLIGANAGGPGGWTLRFSWKQRRIIVAPAGIAKVFLTGGVPDYSVKWLPDTGSAPNGVTVPELTGYAVEFWRQTKHNGGKRGAADLPKIRAGRRFLPYFRGAMDVFTFHRNDFLFSGAPNQNNYRFKTCYYNPATGARSVLSAETIFVQRTNRAEQRTDGARRLAGSVWLE